MGVGAGLVAWFSCEIGIVDAYIGVSPAAVRRASYESRTHQQKKNNKRDGVNTFVTEFNKILEITGKKLIAGIVSRCAVAYKHTYTCL